MTALSVKNLGKEYPSFTLKDVSFSLEEGRVLGLVGANGAGKSTTIKGLLGLIRATGEASVFSLPASGLEAKALVGYAGGGFRFYPRKKVKQLEKALACVYATWSDERFQELCRRFSLETEKRVSELSEGMKVKLALAIALSHGAKLLILDEPTSGLDPLSREEFCDVILALTREEGISVLFSTHITSDLERIADDVVLLSHGHVLLNDTLEAIGKQYYLATAATQEESAGFIGGKPVKHGYEGLIPRGGEAPGMTLREPTLDEIFIHLEYERRAKE